MGLRSHEKTGEKIWQWPRLLQWGRRNRKEGQSLDYHNVTGNVPFPLWFPSAAPAAPVHMRADKNVLSLTVTRCTFVHKHVQMEKAAAQPNYIIHDHVCDVSPFKRYVLSDEETFFFFSFFFFKRIFMHSGNFVDASGLALQEHWAISCYVWRF